MSEGGRVRRRRVAREGCLAVTVAVVVAVVSFSLSGQHAVLLGDSSTNKIGVDTLKSKRLRL